LRDETKSDHDMRLEDQQSGEINAEDMKEGASEMETLTDQFQGDTE
jgi:hypothetical protein